MLYNIVSFCYGNNFETLLPYWMEHINKKCKNYKISIVRPTDYNLEEYFCNGYAWWDIYRMKKIVELVRNNEIVVHIDLDIVIFKDIMDLINLPYDIIFSKEHFEDNAFPIECSKILGLGVCSGFFIVKPTALRFIEKIFSRMMNRTYDNYSDQVNIMKYIVNNTYLKKEENVILDNVEYINTIIEIDNIRICILDFDIIRRDSGININHYCIHYNKDDIGFSELICKFIC